VNMMSVPDTSILDKAKNDRKLSGSKNFLTVQAGCGRKIGRCTKMVHFWCFWGVYINQRLTWIKVKIRVVF